MMELNAELLVRKAEQLLNEEKNFRDAIQLYKAAAILYRNNGQLNLATATLSKIGESVQDNGDFYKEAIEAYQEIAKIYEQESNQESYSNALMSAAFVAQKAKDNSLTIRLFLQAGEGYQAVAQTYWRQGQSEYAWDNIQLSCRCWKSALETSGIMLSKEES